MTGDLRTSMLFLSPSKIPGLGMSDPVTKGNRIFGKSHSVAAVCGLTTSYGFFLSSFRRRPESIFLYSS